MPTAEDELLVFAPLVSELLKDTKYSVLRWDIVPLGRQSLLESQTLPMFCNINKAEEQAVSPTFLWQTPHNTEVSVEEERIGVSLELIVKSMSWSWR